VASALSLHSPHRFHTPLVPASKMALPFLNFMTHEIPFSWPDNTLSDESYPAPRSKSVGYAQPCTIPKQIRTDLVNLVSPLEYQMFTHISTSQNVRNSERFGDLPSGGITFPGIDATDATALPIYPDLEIDFRGLETGSTQGSTPRTSRPFYHALLY
jgi:hypothetical protein